MSTILSPFYFYSQTPQRRSPFILMAASVSGIVVPVSGVGGAIPQHSPLSDQGPEPPCEGLRVPLEWCPICMDTLQRALGVGSSVSPHCSRDGPSATCPAQRLLGRTRICFLWVEEKEKRIT